MTPAGGCATFNANPNAPGKLLLSRTTKVPGGLFFNIFMAKSEFNWKLGGIWHKTFFPADCWFIPKSTGVLDENWMMMDHFACIYNGWK